MLTAVIVDHDPHEAGRLSRVLRQIAQFSTVALAADRIDGLPLIRSLRLLSTSPFWASTGRAVWIPTSPPL